jgi:phosphoserine phosphatase
MSEPKLDSSNLSRTALVYDFDGTLAPGNIQEHTFIPNYLGTPVADFWDEVRREQIRHDADSVLVYMRLMLERAKAKGVPVTRDVLEAHGRDTPRFDGVDTWFDRINEHARERGLAIEHYIISSGSEEMMRGCSIYKHFRRVFASRYAYDEAGEAVWPAIAVNYTTKTQFLFRINKGVENSWDNEPVNRWMPMDERPLPFSRMIYLGDGDTDIPSMKMVRHQGGYSIGVFDPAKWTEKDTQRKVYNLISEDRAHFVAPADYRPGSQLDVVVRGILGRIARAEGYRER